MKGFSPKFDSDDTMCFIFTVTKYKPAVEGVVDLWSPLFVPGTVNIFKMQHQTVHVYLKHKRFKTNAVDKKLGDISNLRTETK